MISEKGLEGSDVYEINRDLRQNQDLKIDLLPDWSLKKLLMSSAKQAKAISFKKRSTLDLKNKRV